MLAAILMAAGYGLQAFGTYQAGKKQAKALRYEADIAMRNAQAAREEAFRESQAQQLQAERGFAETKAGYAAAGVSGVGVDAVMLDSAISAEFDRLNIIFGGDVRSNAFRSEAARKMAAAKDIREASLLETLSVGARGAGSAVDQAPTSSGNSGYSSERTRYYQSGNYSGGAPKFGSYRSSNYGTFGE